MSYIITGTYGKGGEGHNGTASTMANGKLNVSVALWKVIVVLPLGSDKRSDADYCGLDAEYKLSWRTALVRVPGERR